MKLIIPELLFIVFFTFLITSAYSQNDNQVKTYLDENLSEISLPDFEKKMNSFIYSGWAYETDSAVVYKIIDEFKFGKFTKDENIQVRELLSRQLETTSNIDAPLVLIFVDTLKGYKEIGYPRANYNKTTAQFNTDRQNDDLMKGKCYKQDAKLGFKTFYLFHSKNGYDYQPKHFNWHKVSDFVKDYLFQNQRSVMILKPDGSYFYYLEYFDSFIEYIMETEDWEPYFREYERAKKTLSPEPVGRFLRHTKSKYSGSIRKSEYETNCHYSSY